MARSLDPFLITLRQRVSLSALIGQKVTLVHKGRLFVGLCPFHPEKTPSFTVNDEKGTYHCFGCGAHGDAIDFVCHEEGVSFIEAVKSLAAFCGLEMPLSSPSNEPKEWALLEKVSRWFHRHLLQEEAVLSYLTQRGLSSEHIEMFQLGWAPGQGLIQAAREWGFPIADLITCGLVVRLEQGHVERFRQRLIFPISNDRKQVVAFGGRLLKHSPSAPKYLNSPETAFFKKAHTLYKGPRRKGPVVLVEGYMDVIALSAFCYGAAPLGTAVSEVQLTQLWKMSEEPIVCFDGDQAGRSASFHLALMALSHLKPGKSLRFVQLPEGHDPHSFVHTYGETVFMDHLHQSLPLSTYLFHIWQNELVQALTPERKAYVKTKAKSWIARITDRDVRRFYQEMFFRPQTQKPIPDKIPSFSSLAFYQKLLLGMLVLYPWLIDNVREALASLEFTSPWLQIQQYLLSLGKDDEVSSSLSERLGEHWCAIFASVRPHIPNDPCDLEAYWFDLFNAYQMCLYKKSEISSLSQELFEVPGTWERLQTLTEHEEKR